MILVFSISREFISVAKDEDDSNVEMLKITVSETEK
ncbi:MAG: hypothetical protein ACI85N_001781 [Gammaproteobacteria bacterium]|jgi:hypothetical protein